MIIKFHKICLAVCPCIPTINLIIMFTLPCKDEHPLTEYEKVRARNIMRNNRMFQSLGIGAIASMIRKTNGVQEGRSDEVQEGSGGINDDPEYNPKEDEVIDGEEVDDVVVSKTVKVQTLSCLEGWGSFMLCYSLCSHISLVI